MQVAEEAVQKTSLGAAPHSDSNTMFPHAEACTFWRGRVALYAILRVLGIGTGDVVLVPGYTCFAVPSAVLFTGARPVYADIDPSTFNVSLATFERAYRDSVPGTVKAVLVQHTYGLPADISPILAWAKSHDLTVIEDCAHALGSSYRDERGRWREVGLFGDAAFFSSQWTKPISTGLGGWGRFADSSLHQHLQDFRQAVCVDAGLWESWLLAAQVFVRDVVSSPSLYWLAITAYQNLYRRGLLIGTSSNEEFRAERPTDYAKKMSSFQEGLLRRHLVNKSVQVHRRKLKEIYDNALDQAGIRRMNVPSCADPVLLRYPVRVTNKAEMMSKARNRRIELGDWYKHPVDVPDGISPEVFAYTAGMCPESERAAAEVINLPMHSGISEHSAEQTVKFVKECR